jgi:UPF0755 protein
MRKLIYIIAILSFVIVISLAGFSYYEYQRFLVTPANVSVEGYKYTVKPGSNLNSLSKDLTNKGLTTFPALYLSIYGRLQNNAHLIKAGEYNIEQGTTLPQLLQQFIEGSVVQYSFTIIEGNTSAQLLSQLTKQAQLQQTIKTDEVLKEIGATEPHIEGLFLPETYHYPAGTTDVEFLKRAYRGLQTTLNDEWQNRAADLPYKSPYEALIMASIIEKETGIAEERGEIAGVFVRRLKKGMRLQTDPTVIYGMGTNYNGNIRRKDLRTDTPYNTYTRHGLPPTPIALASKQAIHAALHPKAGKSLYFVATGKDGRHKFSATLAEHNKAVRKYQLKK